MANEPTYGSWLQGLEVARPLKKTLLHFSPLRPLIIFSAILGLTLLFWPARIGRSDNFVFYFPNAHHFLPFEVIGQTKYLPLLQLLNLVGKVDALQERGTSLKVWFGDNQLELQDGDKRPRVNKLWVSLLNPVRISNGQWMVPADFITAVLPKVAHDAIKYQTGSNRVFVGDLKPSSFTVRLDQVANGARLTVQFTEKMTVRTAAKDGMWVMSLGDHPVEPLEQTFHFQDPYVQELRFDDQDGTPKLILTPTAGGLNFYPALAEDGKVLLADVLKSPAAVVEQAKPSEAPPAAATSAPQTPAGTEELPATQPGPPLPVVVLDPGHGGQDTGARSRDGVLEKDLVAQVVSRARLGLLNTKKYRILLTRVGDTNLSFEQREVAANIARPAVFLTFHAGNLGASAPRIGIYTYQPSSSSESPRTREAGGRFVFWTRVQEAHLDRSRQLAQTLQQHFAKIPGVTADVPAEAPVRALRSVDAPAVAIELGSLSPDADAGALGSSNFQQQISNAIVQALEDFQRRQS